MPESSKLIKPTKPHPDYPLFPHRNGQWAKKINGRLLYFGTWDGPDQALVSYNDNIAHILSTGRKKPTDGDGGNVADLCNRFLTYKRSQLESGEIGQRSFDDYHAACSQLIDTFGRDRNLDHLTPDDFRGFRNALSKCKNGNNRSLVSLKNLVGRVRVVLNFGFDESLFSKPRPQVVGKAFTMPSKRALKRERQAKPKKLYSAEQIRLLLEYETVSTQMRAMILLAINGGYGNEDCAQLCITSIDFDRGWIDQQLAIRRMLGSRRNWQLEQLPSRRRWLGQLGLESRPHREQSQ